MSHFPRFLCLLMMVLFTLSLVGCNGPDEPLAVAHGTVSYKGTPLPGGTIVFTPDASQGGSGASARAEIKSDGTFILRTGEEFGAAPGWHRVTVASVLPAGPPLQGQPFAMPPTLVPVKYRDPELSGLRARVKSGEDNTINFNLD